MGPVTAEGGTRLTPGRSDRARALAAGAARWVSRAPYLRKWLVLGVAIGAIAGLGAIAFYAALHACTELFLGVLAGYHPPTPVGEGGAMGGVMGTAPPARPWALPLVAGLGALLSGLLVYRFAPEAEGHGTDAAIAAVHHNPRGVRFRAVVVKIVASALTIGSGGSAGREGPTGQISAGFGSLMTRALDLSPADGRVAVSTGIGSGIGAIFGAPLGGAVLAAEILYRDDFDAAALLPCFIASAVSYAIFGAVEGYAPLFGYAGGYHFGHPVTLAWFALIGVIGGVIGILYAKGFYGIADLFGRVPLPKWVRPAIGGLMVGAIAIVIPQVIGTGYGWVQESLGPQLLSIPLWIVLVLPLARILATGLSIGSGGSGGIFGPGMVIGAFVGAGVWRLFEPVVPSMGHDPAPYVIVGMMCCFGSIARAPLAIMLMVAEMTGSLSILAPAMVAVGLAWLIVRRSDDTIYRSQLRSRADAPAQRLLAGLPLLAAIPTARAMAPPRLVLAAGLPADEGLRRMDAAGVQGAPVVDGDGRFEGTVARTALEGTERQGRPCGDAADAGAPVALQETDLGTALEALTAAPASWVPVTDDDRRVVGILSTSDLVHAYRRELADNVRRLSDPGPGTGLYEVRVTDASPAAHRELGSLALPAGVLVTAVTRGDDVVVPTGRTTLLPADRLTVIGPDAGLAVLGTVERPDRR
ncbi:MAG TPA: chloride channel protein [Acidimicrobiales bacterium]|nr:chloride channel protein [Acidimicrobiales bacterium]